MKLNILKRIGTVILSAAFAAALMPPCSAAEQAITASFDGLITAEGMNVTSSSSVYSEYSGVTGITLSAEEGNTSNAYIKVNINDSIAKNITDYSNVTVNVTYYDNGYGWFKLIYDSIADNRLHSECVYTTDSKAWKTYSFVLDDAQFNNASLSNMDFLVSVYDDTEGVTHAQSKYSPEAVTISDIEVILHDTKRSVKADIQNNGTGNIFFTGETPLIAVNFPNRTNADKSIEISYSVTDEDGNTVTEGSDSALVAANQTQSKTFTIPTSKYGLYRFNVEITGGDIYDSDETGFSYCMLNEEQNDPVGFCVGWRYNRSILPTMVKAGFQNVRQRLGNWDAYCDYHTGELKDGNINTVISETKEFKENGFDVIMLLQGLPNYYKTDGYGKLATTQAGYEAFGEFAGFMAENLKDYVDYFELCNEPDLDNGKAMDEDGAYHYAQMVKNAYSAIKNVDEELQVGIISSALAWNDNRRNWAKMIFNNFESERYFDYLTLHPYGTLAYPHVPEHRSIHLNFDKWRDVLSEYTMDYNDSFLLTEFGYHTTLANQKNESNASEIQARNRQIRQFPIILSDSLEHELMVYDLADAGVNKIYKENNFGILHSASYSNPLEAKPVFPAICAYNRLTSNAEACEELLGVHGRPDATGENFVYKYTLSDRKVYMLWNCEGTGTINVNDYITDAENAVYYDIYGNVIDADEKVSADGVCTLTEEPFYAVVHAYGEFTNFPTGEVSLSVDGQKPENNQTSLVVLKPGAQLDENWWRNAEFFDQYTTDQTGAFNTEFKVSPSHELYSARVSNLLYPVEFSAISSEIEEINIYRDNELLTEIDGLLGGDSITVMLRLPADYTSADSSLICVYYDNDVLKELNISNEFEQNELGFISHEIELIDTAEFDELKIMIWNSVAGMIPIRTYKSYTFGG